MIIAGFMEMLSVALILPFAKALMDPERIMSNSIVKNLCDILHINSGRYLLIVLAFAIAGLFVLKNVFLLFQMYLENRFVYNNLFYTQVKLLQNYLSRPYEYYLNVQSGEILRVIQNDALDTFSLLISTISMTSELIVSGMLIVTVLVIAPVITISMAAVLFVLLGVILLMMRPKLKRAGIDNQNAHAAMNQWLIQSIQGIKEIKLLKKESFFESKYKTHGKIYVNTNAKYKLYSSAPRFLIEGISMGLFFIVIAILIIFGYKMDEIFPMLSGVAVAAVRLLPATNRIAQNMSSIAFGEPKLDKMIENLSTMDIRLTEKNAVLSVAEENNLIFENCIQFNNITYKYPSGTSEVLSNASFSILRGESIGIIGTSGSGKTTAIDILLGLLIPQRGNVLVDGVDIFDDLDSWINQIGYIPQTIFMLDGSIKENVAFGSDPESIDDEQVWKALEEASLFDYVKGLPDGLDSQIGERGVRLSGGQRQRIGIARALYRNPSFIVFDEATSALDGDTESAIMDSINKLHGLKTMVIITHRLSTVEKCDHIFKVNNGTIIKER
jgi:ABC-type multidrug transport system fused ATPase/permease subunit